MSFSKSISIRLNPYSGTSLHLIQNKIWCSYGYNGIKIYDFDLKQKGSIASESMGYIYDLADLGTYIAVAAEKGVFIIKPSGERVMYLSHIHVTSIKYHSSMLYCVSGAHMKGDIYIHVYDTHTWTRIRRIKSPCQCDNRYYHTIHIDQQVIIIACPDKHKFHTVTLTGEPISTDGQYGGNLGEFNRPYICSDTNGPLIVADRNNNRLLQRQDETWFPVIVVDGSNHNRVQLKRKTDWIQLVLRPMLFEPRDALFVNDALYVLDDWGESIVKYTRRYENI